LSAVCGRKKSLAWGSVGRINLGKNHTEYKLFQNP